MAYCICVSMYMYSRTRPVSSLLEPCPLLFRSLLPLLLLLPRLSLALSLQQMVLSITLFEPENTSRT